MNWAGVCAVLCAKSGHGRKDGGNFGSVPRLLACIGWESPGRGVSAVIGSVTTINHSNTRGSHTGEDIMQRLRSRSRRIRVQRGTPPWGWRDAISLCVCRASVMVSMRVDEGKGPGERTKGHIRESQARCGPRRSSSMEVAHC